MPTISIHSISKFLFLRNSIFKDLSLKKHGHQLIIIFLFALSGNFSSNASAGVFFNEMMFDPIPNRGVSIKTEYIELINTSDTKVNLFQWKLCDLKSCILLPSISVKSGQIILLLPQKNNDVLNLNEELKWVKLAKWLSLNNDQESIQLFNEKDELIDAYQFSLSSWKPFKKFTEGGIALQRFIGNQSCLNIWRPSLSTSLKKQEGGSPGMPNTLDWLEDLTIKFDTKQLPFSTNTVSSLPFTISDKIFPYLDLTVISIGSISIFKEEEDVQTFFTESTFNPAIQSLKTNIPLQVGLKYHIVLNEISLCIDSRPISISIDLIFPNFAQQKEIIFNEIMFDPSPGQVEFIELFNRTDFYISTSDLRLIRRNPYLETPFIFKGLPTDIIPPQSFLILTKSKSKLISHYGLLNEDQIIESSEIPSLVNSGATLILSNEKGEFIDEVNYSPHLHHHSISNTEGISLERTNAYDQLWTSADSIQKASPGEKNSHLRSIPNNTVDMISITPKFINFTKEPSTLFQFQLRSRDGFNTVKLYVTDIRGNLIKRWSDAQFVGRQSNWVWDGRNDQGRLVESGRYILSIILEKDNIKTRVFRDSLVIYNP